MASELVRRKTLAKERHFKVSWPGGRRLAPHRLRGSAPYGRSRVMKIGEDSTYFRIWHLCGAVVNSTYRYTRKLPLYGWKYGFSYLRQVGKNYLRNKYIPTCVSRKLHLYGAVVNLGGNYTYYRYTRDLGKFHIWRYCTFLGKCQIWVFRIFQKFANT